MSSLSLSVKRPFSFRPMVISHGWCDLKPFRWNDEEQALETTFSPASRPFTFRVTSRADGREGQKLVAAVVGGGALTREERTRAREKIAWMFRLGEDFRPLHRLCREKGRLLWVADGGLGAFLRNPTLFEEFTKVLLTTNVSWAGTKLMVHLLLETLGEEVDRAKGDGPTPRAFPRAEVIAGVSEAWLRKEVRVGYRAPYLIDFASGVASGRIDLEGFGDASRTTEQLSRSIGAMRGFGPYAVSALLMSLGRYDTLILDSWIRKTAAKVHFRSSKVTDRSINRVYAPWGEWKALACWFDSAWETWLRDALSDGKGADRRDTQ